MKSITIITWNVWVGEDIDNVTALLKEVDADISCVQEVSSTSSKQIADALGQDFYTMGDVGIFSKFAFLAKHHQLIHAADNHAYVEVVLRAGSKLIRVANVHLTYSRKFKMNTERAAEAQKLYELISPHQLKFILTGDMNADTGSPIINTLSDKLVDAGPDSSHKTWTTKPFSYQDFGADSLDWRLDYIFVTPDIKVSSSRVVQTEFSDHLPIVAEIEI